MSRLALITDEQASDQTRTLFEATKKKLGVVPNMVRALAASPAALGAYLGMSGALASAALRPALRERIALLVGEVNGCGYCLSAHTAIGAKLGLSETEIAAARRGHAPDAKDAAILALARAVLLERGSVRDADLRAARAAGATDGEIAEVVATVALNVFTNWFNHVAQPAIDFPEVEPGVDGQTSCTTGTCGVQS